MEPMRTHSILYAIAAVLLMLTADLKPFSTEAAPTSSTSGLESLGEMLGLHMDSDQLPKKHTVPDFLQNVYDCWNSGRQDCMPAEASSSDVNIVRSVIGTVESNPVKAVQSYNEDRELRSSLSIVFNMSYTLRQPEAVRYAMFRIYKQALTVDQKAEVDAKCNNTSNLQLQLYTAMKVEDREEEIVTLKENIPIETNTLLRDSWHSFHNLTDLYSTQYATLSEKAKESSYHTFSLRIAIGGSCSGLSPSLLGFTSKEGFEPQLIGFSKNADQDSMFNSRILAEIARRQSERQRRQAEEDGSGEEDPTNNVIPPIGNVTEPTARAPQTIEQIKLARCQLYRHNISFVDLGWDSYIVEPLYYEANFCAGRCEYPLKLSDNTTKHSFIQGVANHHNPHLIPPPCCVPVPEELTTLPVVKRESGSVIVAKWDNMIANSCGCL